MSVYVQKVKLRAEHVDFRRRLKPSVLMRLFQECCIAHTEELGMGRKMTLDRGFLWVVTSERFQINRWPEYDETITLRCTPGPMLHYFFPRHFIVLDEKGEVLIRATALWALIDQKTRQMIDPKEKGIVIEGAEDGSELAPMTAFPLPEPQEEFPLRASYSKVDINGHLNNAAYIDLLMDRIPLETVEKATIKEMAFCFKKEIPLGLNMGLSYANRGDSYYLYCPNFSAKATLKE